MNKILDLDELYLRKKYSVMDIVRPRGGIVSGVARVIGDDASPDFEMANATIGNLTDIFPHVSMSDGSDVSKESIGGSGADVTSEMAWLRAVMEGVERYASMAYTEEEFLVASGNELGDEALDLNTIPRCSKSEYLNPKCPYAPADKSKPIRWIKGYSLTEKKYKYVPALMTHLYLKPGPDERFWQMISTGTAAHFNLDSALVSGINEVIERDAIALTWLAKLPLSKIDVPSPPPPEVAANLSRLAKSRVKHTGFDATTDFGIPTVYSVQTLEGHPHLSQYVNCSTEFSALDAYAKTIREAAPARPVFNDGIDVPDDLSDFVSLHHGAAYLGRPEFRDEFGFLLSSSGTIGIGDMGGYFPEDDNARLSVLIDKLKSMNMEAIAVDLTTEDLREVGVWVVKVVIPGLMPMTSTHSVDFWPTQDYMTT